MNGPVALKYRYSKVIWLWDESYEVLKTARLKRRGSPWNLDLIRADGGGKENGILQCDRKKTSQEILCFDYQKLEIFTNYLKSFFQLWIIGNVTSWGIILSVIIHVDLNKLNSHCGVVSFLITSSTFISRPKWSTLIKLPFTGSWASVKGSFLGTLVNTSFLRAS